MLVHKPAWRIPVGKDAHGSRQTHRGWPSKSCRLAVLVQELGGSIPPEVETGVTVATQNKKGKSIRNKHVQAQRVRLKS